MIQNKWLAHSRGIGLLELMLSLAIIAILLIMATRYYQSASSNNSINSAVDMLNGVKSGVKNYMNSNMNSATLPSISQLVSAGYLPQAYNNSSTASPWGGNICVTTGTATPSTSCSTLTAGTTFGVVLSGMPTASSGSVCQQLANRISATLSTTAGEAAVCSGDGSSIGVTYAL